MSFAISPPAVLFYQLRALDESHALRSLCVYPPSIASSDRSIALCVPQVVLSVLQLVAQESVCRHVGALRLGPSFSLLFLFRLV